MQDDVLENDGELEVNDDELERNDEELGRNDELQEIDGGPPGADVEGANYFA